MIPRNRHYLILTGITLLCGMLFYGIYNDLIILHLPSKKGVPPVYQSSAQRKKVKLIYFNQEKFLTEEQEILITNNNQQNLSNLITNWLNLLEEEEILSKKVTLQSVLTDKSDTEAFISFDRSPFLKEQSTYQKLMFIEALLKTIKGNGLPFISIRFLVNFKRFNDPHLDFSQSWPITGYMSP